MRVLILHNQVGADDPALDRDVLDQVEAVGAALDRLGHRCTVTSCTLDLAAVDRTLDHLRPDLVFNLVESLGGADRLIHLAPALLEARGIPCTGSSSDVLRRTSHKTHAKEDMSAAGIPTPPTLAQWPGAVAGRVPAGSRWIVKSTWEHGSRGLGDDVVLEPGTDVGEAMARLAGRLGGECLAEPFLDGRELNLSLLETPQGPRVLPPAEIEFVGFPQDKPRIVGYAAKWDEGSFESQHTPRTFDFPASDAPLVEQVAEIARLCWATLGLRGWARVDFRVDREGHPWVLEVNANPCLAPDAGFPAALERGGLAFDDAIAAICDAALRGRAVLEPAVAGPLLTVP
ncbi:MAG TPA: D-alanine--D-alanine ligase [Thermoanaerobaculia bacterium]|nr:D-alanine--D-alanine ligase [Thermoanaerobaculia bacterium]